MINDKAGENKAVNIGNKVLGIGSHIFMMMERTWK